MGDIILSSKRRDYSRPKECVASPFVRKYVSSADFMNRPIVDVGCGYGRNGLEVLKAGGKCVFCDIDTKCLQSIKDSNVFFDYRGNYCLKQIDFEKEPWPFPPDSCGGIINVHYYNRKLIEGFISSIRVGGFLLIETIDNRGGNHFELPMVGYLRYQIMPHFKIIYYKEGKPKEGKAKVKLFAIRIPSKSI